MKNVVPDSSELEQKLQRVEADERRIEKLQGYERQRRAKLALFIGLGAALVIGGIDEWGVVALVAAVLAAGLLPYLFLRFRRRALERRRDRVLNSGSDEG